MGYLKLEVLELDSLGCNSETGLLEPGSSEAIKRVVESAAQARSNRLNGVTFELL